MRSASRERIAAGSARMLDKEQLGKTPRHVSRRTIRRIAATSRGGRFPITLTRESVPAILVRAAGTNKTAAAGRSSRTATRNVSFALLAWFLFVFIFLHLAARLRFWCGPSSLSFSVAPPDRVNLKELIRGKSDWRNSWPWYPRRQRRQLHWIEPRLLSS
jgi:hypothetical protein